MAKYLQTSFLILISFFCGFAVKAQHSQFQTGDIFLAQGGGIVQWRDSSAVLIKTINTGDGAANGSGTCVRIHPLTGELWVVNNYPNINGVGIRIVHKDGTVGNAISITSAQQKTPTSVTFDSHANAYVGDLWDGEIVKLDPNGAVIDHYAVSTDGFIYGPEWVEMDCNDSIIYYTNLEERIKRYNVVTRQQLPNFADLTGIPTWLFAMRRMPDSSMIVVSADSRILRLNAAGHIIQTYVPATPCGLFGMAATPDGQNFWVGGGAFYAPMYKFNIATGKVVDSFLAGPGAGSNVYGIAIYGDELKNCYPITAPITVNTVNTVNAYPNPSSGSFIVQTDISGTTAIRIFNKLGQMVFSKEYNLAGPGNKTSFNLRGLAAGIYLMELITKDRKYLQKIIIQ